MCCKCTGSNLSVVVHFRNVLGIMQRLYRGRGQPCRKVILFKRHSSILFRITFLHEVFPCQFAECFLGDLIMRQSLRDCFQFTRYYIVLYCKCIVYYIVLFCNIILDWIVNANISIKEPDIRQSSSAGPCKYLHNYDKKRFLEKNENFLQKKERNMQRKNIFF